MKVKKYSVSEGITAFVISPPAKQYLNYCPVIGFSVSTAPQPDGYFNSCSVGFIEDLAQQKPSSCPLDGALDALEDGSLWLDDDAIKAALESAHGYLMEYTKRTASNG